MDDEVEAAEAPLDRANTSAICASSVTSQGRISGSVERRRQLAHVLFEPLALIRHRQPRAGARRGLRDRPRNRALVGDADDRARACQCNQSCRLPSLGRTCAACASTRLDQGTSRQELTGKSWTGESAEATGGVEDGSGNRSGKLLAAGTAASLVAVPVSVAVAVAGKPSDAAGRPIGGRPWPDGRLPWKRGPPWPAVAVPLPCRGHCRCRSHCQPAPPPRMRMRSRSPRKPPWPVPLRGLALTGGEIRWRPLVLLPFETRQCGANQRRGARVRRPTGASSSLGDVGLSRERPLVQAIGADSAIDCDGTRSPASAASTALTTTAVTRHGEDGGAATGRAAACAGSGGARAAALRRRLGHAGEHFFVQARPAFPSCDASGTRAPL